MSTPYIYKQLSHNILLPQICIQPSLPGLGQLKSAENFVSKNCADDNETISDHKFPLNISNNIITKK